MTCCPTQQPHIREMVFNSICVWGGPLCYTPKVNFKTGCGAHITCDRLLLPCNIWEAEETPSPEPHITARSTPHVVVVPRKRKEKKRRGGRASCSVGPFLACVAQSWLSLLEKRNDLFCQQRIFVLVNIFPQ